jgi:hypothetical protein
MKLARITVKPVAVQFDAQVDPARGLDRGDAGAVLNYRPDHAEGAASARRSRRAYRGGKITKPSLSP